MFDQRKFKAQVMLKGMSLRKVAAELGIDEATLHRKMHGKSDFYCKEAQKACDVLGIQNPCEIFFAPDIT